MHDAADAADMPEMSDADAGDNPTEKAGQIAVDHVDFQTEGHASTPILDEVEDEESADEELEFEWIWKDEPASRRVRTPRRFEQLAE
jgi:hypothetical protein